VAGHCRGVGEFTDEDDKFDEGCAFLDDGSLA